MLRSLVAPFVLTVIVVVSASVGTLLLVVIAYGLASLLGHWLPLTPFELTALSFAGLLVLSIQVLRVANAAIGSAIDSSTVDEDEIDYSRLGAYAEDDDEATVTRAATARSTRQRKSKRQ